MQYFTHENHLWLKTYFSSKYKRKSQHIWSKAFSISNLIKILCSLDFIILSKHSLVINTESRIFLPVTKTFWDFEMIFSITILMWLARTLEIILYTPLTKLIGWKSLISKTSTFLRIKAMNVALRPYLNGKGFENLSYWQVTYQFILI